MSEESEKALKRPIEFQEDWLLQILVNVADNSDFDITVTLQMSGFLVRSCQIVCVRHEVAPFE